MRRSLIVCLLGVAACDSVFRVDHVRGIDAPDAASDVCIQDSFGAPLDRTKWMVTGENHGLVIFTESDVLHVDVPEETSTSPDLFGGVHTGLRNLIGASTEIEVAQVADSAEPSTVGLLLAVDGYNQYRLVVSKGQVVAIRILGGATTNLSATTFEPAKHRFLRIRHDIDGTEIVFETRGAAGDYETFAHIPVELDLSVIDTWLYAQSFNDTAAAFSAQFDSVLMTGPNCN